MNFFDRKRKFIYFSGIDTSVKITDHYDIFAYSVDDTTHATEYLGTFYNLGYARLFSLIPDMYRELQGSKNELNMIQHDNVAYSRVKSIEALLNQIDNILTEGNNER